MHQLNSSLEVTDDTYGALLPDPRAIMDHPKLDLEIACDRLGLAPETQLLADGRYERVADSDAPRLLGLSEDDVAAAARELRTAKPALKARLAPYYDAAPSIRAATDSYRERRKRVKQLQSSTIRVFEH